MSELSFREVLERVKAEGEQERQTIDAAVRVSEIIEKVTEARVRRGITQRELADACGIRQPAIARMESLKTIPRLNTLVRIAEALDVEIRAEEKEPTGGVSALAPKTIYLWTRQQENQTAYRPAAAQA